MLSLHMHIVGNRLRNRCRPNLYMNTGDRSPKKPMKTHRILNKLEFARGALLCAQTDDDVSQALSDLGYSETALQEAQNLYDQAATLREQYRAATAHMKAASQAKKATKAEAHHIYSLHIQQARVLFRQDTQIVELLELRGSRKRRQAEHLVEMRNFYARILANVEIQARFAECSVTAEDLQAAAAAVAAFESASHSYTAARSEAANLSRRSQAALAALDSWLMNFVSVSRAFLIQQPTVLQKLGLH